MVYGGTQPARAGAPEPPVPFGAPPVGRLVAVGPGLDAPAEEVAEEAGPEEAATVEGAAEGSAEAVGSADATPGAADAACVAELAAAAPGPEGEALPSGLMDDDAAAGDSPRENTITPTSPRMTIPAPPRAIQRPRAAGRAAPIIAGAVAVMLETCDGDTPLTGAGSGAKARPEPGAGGKGCAEPGDEGKDRADSEAGGGGGANMPGGACGADPGPTAP